MCGAKYIMQTPNNAIAAPIKSYLSGEKLSNFIAHSKDITMKKPPYVAYTLAKLAVCQVATTP